MPLMKITGRRRCGRQSKPAGQARGDDGDARNPIGMGAGHLKRHDAAIGDAGDIDAPAVDEPHRGQIIGKLEEEAILRAGAGVPILVEALGIDSDDSCLLGEVVEARIAAHLGGGAPAAMEQEDGGPRSLRIVGTEDLVVALNPVARDDAVGIARRGCQKQGGKAEGEGLQARSTASALHSLSAAFGLAGICQGHAAGTS